MKEGASGKAWWYLVMLLVPLLYAASGYLLRKCAELDVSFLQLLLVTNLVSGAMFAALNGSFIPTSDSAGIFTDALLWFIYLAGVVVNLGSLALLLRASSRLAPFVLSFANHAALVFTFVMSAIAFSLGLSLPLALAALLVVASSLLSQDSEPATV